MEVKITRSRESGKWTIKLDDNIITEQATLLKAVSKFYKYLKSQS